MRAQKFYKNFFEKLLTKAAAPWYNILAKVREEGRTKNANTPYAEKVNIKNLIKAIKNKYKKENNTL